MGSRTQAAGCLDEMGVSIMQHYMVRPMEDGSVQNCVFIEIGKCT